MGVNVVSRNTGSATPSTLRFRHDQQGPESELVDWFLKSNSLSLPQGSSAVVFREPRLESGFPDLVVAVWEGDISHSSHLVSVNLEKSDYSLLHKLLFAHTRTNQALRVKSRAKSIDRLLKSGLIEEHQDGWRAKRLNDIFFLTHIIAVEAKVKNWSRALTQAFANKWFASTSVVILPDLPRGLTDSTVPARWGIQVRCKGDPKIDIRKLPMLERPKCTSAWLLQDWAIRAAMHEGR